MEDNSDYEGTSDKDLESEGSYSDDTYELTEETTDNEAISGIENDFKNEEKVSQELENNFEKVIVSAKDVFLLNYCENMFLNYMDVNYQDILSLTLNGTSFMVDGTMLITHSMADCNWNKDYGGQMLHLVYLCERRLQLFVQKNANFHVVFFDSWKHAFCDYPTIILAQSVLFTHLKNNSKFKVFNFISAGSIEFRTHLKIHRPSFLLVDLNINNMAIEDFNDVSNLKIDLTFYMQLFGALALSVPCVDIGGLKLEISTLFGFIVELSCNVYHIFNKVLPRLMNTLMNDTNGCESYIVPVNVGLIQQILKNDTDIRIFVGVFASVCLLLEDDIYDDYIRAFLLYISLIQSLPLKNRACNLLLKFEGSTKTFVDRLHYFMNIALEQSMKYEISNVHVADLWQGTFYATVLHVLNEMENPDQSVLNSLTKTLYEDLIYKTSKLGGRPLKAFPIWKKRESLYIKNCEYLTNVDEQQIVLIDNFLPVSCELSIEFCDDIIGNQICLIPEEITTLNSFIKKNALFTESRHWHVNRPLTDELERVKDDSFEKRGAQDKFELRKLQRIQARYVKHLLFYGKSLEGENFNYKPIICKKNESEKGKRDESGRQKKEQLTNKKGGKQKKCVKKVSEKEKIVQQNTERMASIKEELDHQEFVKLEVHCKDLKREECYEKAIKHLDMFLKKCKTAQFQLKASLCKCDILFKLWQKECQSSPDLCTRNMTYAKLLFLEMKQILQLYECNDKDKKNISHWLFNLGFEDICLKQHLPKAQKEKHADLSVGISSVRFQLTYLGPELDRDTGSECDPRVDGFIPDKWQRELFDIIDRNESALIVAPTSSGKTYASYYCMKKILEESNDGIVVYVSPTKALVNQVQATVFSRFGHKKMPPGKVVCGVFTRDYRHKALESQILVTVPQCLEILLLSPRRHDWAKRLRYVILDEIHCLAGQAGGISWERCLLMIQCPFLALSATVGEPESFCNWLQEVENFKHLRDENDHFVKSTRSYKVSLIKYSDRHSDLEKHVYSDDGIKQVHPYTFLDEAIIQENSIPNHISLSPRETLEVYDALVKVSPHDPVVEDVSLENYFSANESGFITRNSVRKFEERLRSVVEYWALYNIENFNAMKSELPGNVDIPEVNKSKLYLVNNIFNAVELLKKSNMLPAIFFCYDRYLVEFLSKILAVEYEEIEHVDVIVAESRLEKQMKKKVLDKQCDDSTRKPQGLLSKSLGLLEGNYSLKGIGRIDEKSIAHLERRLIIEGCKQGDNLIRSLKTGIGYHHGGLSAKQKSAVEILFRLRFLNVVFATGTLALGIHMPCKSVIILGDSHYINALEYHQMSGRAGRRGYDTCGNVVFMGIGQRKVQTLMTDRFPVMVGNFPLSVGTVLQLFLLVNQVTSKGVHVEEATACALSRALTLLNCSMAYEKNPGLKVQMQHFFAFAAKLLLLQGLVDEQCNPLQMTGIVTHLRHHEPGNLVFIYLFNSGVFRELCKCEDDGSVSKEAEFNLVLVLSHLFARMPLHRSKEKKKYDNSKVILPQLPDLVKEVIDDYNERVKFVFNKYFYSIATYFSNMCGEDNVLPLTGVKFVPEGDVLTLIEEVNQNDCLERRILSKCAPRRICSTFAALSGNDDTNLYSHKELISNIRQEIFTDIKVVPIFEEMQLNGYAWDFYNHGIAAAIRKDNCLKSGDDFEKLKDFMLVLKCLTLSLEELEPCESDNDPVLKTFRKVTETFQQQFHHSYYHRKM